MEFSRQKYWIRLPFPPPGDLPDPEIKPSSPASPASAGEFLTTALPGRPPYFNPNEIKLSTDQNKT